MSVIFLNLIEEYLTAKGYSSSGVFNPDEVTHISEKIINNLNEIIKDNINCALDLKCNTDEFKVADIMSSNLKCMTLLVKSLTALNTAPHPLKSDIKENLKEWMDTYQKWFDNERDKGMQIG